MQAASRRSLLYGFFKGRSRPYIGSRFVHRADSLPAGADFCRALSTSRKSDHVGPSSSVEGRGLYWLPRQQSHLATQASSSRSEVAFVDDTDDDCLGDFTSIQGRRRSPFESEADYVGSDQKYGHSHTEPCYTSLDHTGVSAYHEQYDPPKVEAFRMRYQSLHTEDYDVGFDASDKSSDAELKSLSAGRHDSAGKVDSGGQAPSQGPPSGPAGSSGTGGSGWTWARPPPRPQDAQQQDPQQQSVYEIPTVINQLLSEGEVVKALEAVGAMDVKVVSVAGKGNLDADTMIFASGRSGAHLRRMADKLVDALKRRKLKYAPGFTGAEGYDCDDWMIVDCYNHIVHLMEPSQRKALDLETHWSSDKFKSVAMPVTKSDEDWNMAHDQLVSEFPVPDEYDPFSDDVEKREKEMRRVLGVGRTRRRR